jgi:Na+/H+ antiporter NhaA
MPLFFLVVGLELTRDLKLQRLPGWRAVALPAAAVLGGLAVPALLYLAINGGGPAADGWAIVLGGDLALGLGVVTLVGPRCPPQLRVLLLRLVIVGDLVAVAVAGLLYAQMVNIVALAVALELFAMVTVLRLLRVLRALAYLMVGVALWVAAVVSGIHPAIVGLLLGVVIAAYPPVPVEVLRGLPLRRWFEPGSSPAMRWEAPLGVDGTVTPLDRLQRRLHSLSSCLVVPLFALANAGVAFDHELLARAVGSPITLGVVASLVVGKLVGGLGASILVVRAGFGAPPRLVNHHQLAAAAALTGIGFTVALFVADLMLSDVAAQEEAKVGILAASVVAALTGWLLFQLPARTPRHPPSPGDWFVGWRHHPRRELNQRMRARDLAITYPSLTPDVPAAEAARLLAEEAVEGVFVEDEQGSLQGCVSDTTLLVFLLPRYLAEDRALVGMLGEDVADALWQRLRGRPLRDLLAAEAVGLAEVEGDDTLLTVAATLARTGASLAVVREDDGRLLGGITTSRLIRQLLGAR